MVVYSLLESLWPGKYLAQSTLLSIRNDQRTQAWAREVPRLREGWGSTPLTLWKELDIFLWPPASGRLVCLLGSNLPAALCCMGSHRTGLVFHTNVLG